MSRECESITPRHVSVPESLAGQRLDRALAALLPEYSRSRLQAWIHAGRVLVDGRAPRPRDAVRAGARIRVRPVCEPDETVVAQPIPLAVVHEEEQLLVVDKAPGLVVHPGAGHPDGTLQNALLHYDESLAALPRAGLVHRLDKNTSGLLLVARTLRAHNALVKAMQAREIHREYLALVCGRLIAGGRVNQPIGRHPGDRVRMAVRPDGRRAVTDYRVQARYRAHTLLRVILETGRTHQIRVHMAWLRHPVLGDPVYGRGNAPVKGASPEVARTLQAFPRQALHARRLRLAHPVSGETLALEAPVPEDMAGLIATLKRADG